MNFMKIPTKMIKTEHRLPNFLSTFRLIFSLNLSNRVIEKKIFFVYEIRIVLKIPNSNIIHLHCVVMQFIPGFVERCSSGGILLSNSDGGGAAAAIV